MRQLQHTMLHWATGVMLIAGLLGCAGGRQARVQPERARALHIHWLPLTLDQQYIETAVRMARDHDVEAFHLSHKLVMDAEDVLNDPERREQVLRAMAAMKQGGLKIWCWTHEIKTLPPGMAKGKDKKDKRVNLRNPELQRFLDAKYDDFVSRALPGLEGLVVTFAETNLPVYQHADPALARQNLEDLAALVRAPLARRGVKLAVRDFVYRKDEMAVMAQAIGGMAPDVALMSKIVPHDWEPFYPVNPMVGAVAPREQWVEFDLGLEYEGQNVLPYSDPRQLLGWLREIRKRGVETVCLRLDRHDGDQGKSALATPWGRLSLDVFTEFSRNPGVSAEEVIARWERTQFPGAARVLELSTRVARRAMFPKKLWYQNHSELPTFNYARSHLTGGGADRLATWTGAPEDKRAEELCDRPTPEWYKELMDEDQQSARDLTEIRRILAENKVDLDARPEWKRGLESLDAYAALFAASKRAHFSVRLFQNDPRAITRGEVERNIDAFEKTAKALEPLPEWMRFHGTKPPSATVKSFREELQSGGK